ncbi:MAG: MFS transporter [Actinobacteria bacterium]|nr:MFS transporter [Actinomycetota bacterium]
MMVSGAVAPLLARYALDDLHASAGTVGILVGSSSVAAIVMRPLLGRLGDRYGMRPMSTLGALVMALGMLILLVATSVAAGAAGRLVSGVAGGAVNTALTAWVIGLVPLERRGHALGIFGVSIWAGIAIGPQVGQALIALGGYPGLWIGCCGIAIAAALCSTRAHAPQIQVEETRPPRHPIHLLKMIARPGTASLIAWAGEGAVTTFLIVHLEARGLAPSGVTGAVSVYTVFAISVIGARLALARWVDRRGPAPVAALSLLVVGAGLLTLAMAGTFAAGAAGAFLLGLGFAPLYPALALLATERLRPEERGSGVGIFSGFMDAGIATGSILGGVLVGAIGSAGTFAVAAALQLVAAALVVGGGGQRSSRRAGFETSIASTAASETPPS